MKHTRRRRLMRLALPPAASIVTHLTLLAGVALVSITATTLETSSAMRPRLAEVELAPAPLPPLPVPSEDRSPEASLAGAPAVSMPVELESMATAEVGISLPEAGPSMTPADEASRLLASAESPPVSASFAGVRAQAARRIVYVVDASGSVVSTFSFIRERLQRSIDRLGPNQKFAVVFFRSQQGEAALSEFNSDGLVRATPEVRANAAAWIDTVRPSGRSDPLAGLRRALELEPDLVFLLAAPIERTHASWGGGRDAILGELDRMNPTHKRTGLRPVVVKTIAFLRPDPTNLLRDIAQRHGDGEGSHRVLPLDQLANDDPDDATTLRVDTSDESLEAALVAAADALARADESGAARACLFGIALPDQRDAAHESGEIAVSKLLLKRPVSQADQRATLLRERGKLLVAASGEGGGRRAQTKTEELVAIAERVLDAGELSDAGAEGARLSTAVAALVLAGDDASRGRARELTLAWLGLQRGGRGGAAARGEALAAMVLADPGSFARRSAELRAHMRESGLARDPRWVLLAAGAEARALAAAGETARAFGAVLELRGDALGVSEETTREIRMAMVVAVHGLLADRPDGGAWRAEMPAEAALLHAVHLGRARATRGQALGVLDAMGRGARANPDALWEAAALRRLDATDDADARAARDLARLATEFPTHDRAGEAAIAAVRLDRRPASERTDAAFVDLLRLAIEAGPDAPEADRWRYELAPLVDARERFELISAMKPTTRDARDAAVLLATTADVLLDRAADTGTRRLILEETVAFLRGARSAELPRFAHGLGVMLIEEESSEEDRGRARERVDRAVGLLALALAATSDDDPARAVRVLDLARGEHAIGRTEEAFARVRDVATRAQPSDAAFWPAWTVLLEITADAGDAQSRKDALAHLARLKLIDRDLGGPDWAARLMSVERDLAAVGVD